MPAAVGSGEEKLDLREEVRNLVPEVVVVTAFHADAILPVEDRDLDAQALGGELQDGIVGVYPVPADLLFQILGLLPAEDLAEFLEVDLEVLRQLLL